jgi:hypothetical protein
MVLERMGPIILVARRVHKTQTLMYDMSLGRQNLIFGHSTHCTHRVETKFYSKTEGVWAQFLEEYTV